jgi:hypothetical protein
VVKYVHKEHKIGAGGYFSVLGVQFSDFFPFSVDNKDNVLPISDMFEKGNVCVCLFEI